MKKYMENNELNAILDFFGKISKVIQGVAVDILFHLYFVAWGFF